MSGASQAAHTSLFDGSKTVSPRDQELHTGCLRHAQVSDKPQISEVLWATHGVQRLTRSMGRSTPLGRTPGGSEGYASDCSLFRCRQGVFAMKDMVGVSYKTG